MKKLLKRVDVYILVIVLLLSIIGVVAIYSAGYNSDVSSDEYTKQIIWISVGIIAMLVTVLLHYNLTATLGYPLYGLVLVLLILVLFTPSVNGARSWFDLGFFTLQPSELMKIAYILVLAKVLEKMRDKDKNFINSFKGLAIVFLVFIVPFALIAIQPDFGTAAVFVAITAFMLYKAKLDYKYIIAVILILLVLIPVVYFFILNETQQERILVFFNPERDPLGSGYNAIQSKLAVGSGKIFGTGILSGTQTQYGYLPVKSSDFIYSVISEEMGFIISSLVVVMYVVLLLRIVKIAKETEDFLGSAICMGAFGMLFFHFLENVGMTIGLMPITGIPLPFLSYGGSSTIVNFIVIGLVLSVCVRRKQTLF